MKESKREKVESWMLKNKKFLNVKAIENDIEVPRGTVQKFLKYGRKLNTKRINALNKWMIGFLSSINDTPDELSHL